MKTLKIVKNAGGGWKLFLKTLAGGELKRASWRGKRDAYGQ